MISHERSDHRLALYCVYMVLVRKMARLAALYSNSFIELLPLQRIFCSVIIVYNGWCVLRIVVYWLFFFIVSIFGMMLTYHRMWLITELPVGKYLHLGQRKKGFYLFGNSNYRIALATDIIAFIYLTCSSLYTCIYVYIAKL